MNKDRYFSVISLSLSLSCPLSNSQKLINEFFVFSSMRGDKINGLDNNFKESSNTKEHGSSNDYLKEVYMDNAATTKVDDIVIKEMLVYYDSKYGNPSSLHSFGLEAQKAIEKSREIIANSINAEKEEIIFTSGATESINFILFSYANANKRKGNHIISTKIEHEAVLSTLEELKNQGFEITLLDVDGQGFIDINKLKEEIKPTTIMVSIIHANNEVGTIQNIDEIGKICEEKEIFFHTDTTQSYTKCNIDVKKMKISSCCFSAHKFHGPKGIGAVYIKKGTKIKPYLFGGGQEKGLRSGTQNVAGIVAMGKAADLAMQNFKKNIDYVNEIKKYLYDLIIKIPNCYLNGPSLENFDKRLCNNLNFSFDFIEGEAMLLYLDMEKIKCSTGSACSSNSLKPSHVLDAMNIPYERMHGTLRFSISKYNTKTDCDYVYEKLVKVVDKLRAMSPLTNKKTNK